MLPKPWTSARGATRRSSQRRRGALLLPLPPALLAMLLLHPRLPAQGATPASSGQSDTHPAAAPTGCLPTHDGYLRARLQGASDLDIQWSDAQLQCDGGVRPTGTGILLTFAGRTRHGGHRLRFVFGIDAAAATGVTRERAANVTVIFEGERRLYSTRGDTHCTVDRLQQTPAAVGGKSRTLRVQARGFCISPATALEGRGDLLLSRFDFAGLIRLGA